MVAESALQPQLHAMLIGGKSGEGAALRVWFLEGFLGPRKSLQRIRLDHFPFRIGRQKGSSLMLEYDGISREHAEIDQVDGKLVVNNLKSTNGTFVNRVLVDSTEIFEHGDIMHLADLEFRLIAEYRDGDLDAKDTRQGIFGLPENMPTGSRELQELLARCDITAALQPIVANDAQSSLFAYELLGRGTHPGLSSSPGELFRIAESLNEGVHLSEIMRRVGIREAYQFDPCARYFTNIHPLEVDDTGRLLDSLGNLRANYPDMDLVLEIHEKAITDSTAMGKLRYQLQESKIELAYDDFGAGQARLIELAEVPPDYIKLDMSLIRGIDRAGQARQEMVKMLVDYARERDILVVAEGIDCVEEADYCERIGCNLLQGFFYGKPVLAAKL